jgi:aryl-alcohol dehydrogenase-like predicted oxidoreductase
MDYAPVGNTGLTASVIGIGTGGPSRVGLKRGGSEENAISVIRQALAHGVTFIDTAEAYGTEELVGRAIREVPRESVVVSTKISRWEDLDTAGIERAVDERLRLLGTDHVDICHLHAVTPDRYDRAVERAYPGLVRAREAGKVRFIGVTEMFNADPGHEMLRRAVAGDLWDAIMVGFNILNQSARDRVLAAAGENGIAVLDMFAVRLALSRRERLVEVMGELIGRGEVDEAVLRECGGTREDPLGWVVEQSDAETLVDAAYRFVRHEPGIHVTLSGTGSADHLRANIASAQRLPLDSRVTAKLRRLFAKVDSVTAQ